MASGDGYQVLSDELGGHASKVDALAERLATAVSAANQVTMDNSAYGVICQPFALLLDPFEQRGVEALRTAEEAVKDSANKVREAVKSYESQESEVSGTMKNLGAPLE